MANTVEIEIIGKDNTGASARSAQQNLNNIGRTAQRLGGTLSRTFTMPLERMAAFILKNDEVQKALEPIATHFKILGDTLAESFIPVIKDLTPALVSLAVSLAAIVLWFSQLTPFQKEVILGFLALAAALGPVLVFVGQLLFFASNLIPVLSFLGSTVLPVLGTILGALSLPVLALIAAIGLLIYVIIRFGADAWNTMTMISAIMRQVLMNIIKWIGDTTKKFYDAGQNLIYAMGDGIVAGANYLISAVVNSVNAAINAAKSAIASFSGNAQAGAFQGYGQPAPSYSEPSYNYKRPGSERHASGADFTVPSNYTNDTYPLGFATAGEHVSITPAGKSGGGVVNIYLNYNPVVSLMDKAEAETKLIPYVRAALRKA